MPILDVEVVVARGEMLPGGLARTIADLTAEIFATDPGRTWVRVRTLGQNDYAENEVGRPVPLPAFVEVLLADPPAGDAARVQARRLTETIATALARPVDRVHLMYAPAGRGRVAFGGELVE